MIKNKKTNLNKDRRFAVVVEALRFDFRIFGEGLSALREKVDAIFEMTGKNVEDIASIKTDIRFIKTDLKTFENRISLLEGSNPT